MITSSEFLPPLQIPRQGVETNTPEERRSAALTVVERVPANELEGILAMLGLEK